MLVGDVSTDRAQYRGNYAMFSVYMCTRVHKFCPKRMRDANVRNHLALDFRRLLGYSQSTSPGSFPEQRLVIEPILFSWYLSQRKLKLPPDWFNFRGLIYIFLNTSIPDLFTWEFPPGCLQAVESKLIERNDIAVRCTSKEQAKICRQSFVVVLIHYA